MELTRSNGFIKRIYYVLIPLLIFGIIQGYSLFPLCLLALIVLLFSNSRHTVGVFLIMYGGVFGGVVRSVYPFVPLYGIFLIALGIIMVWDCIKDMIRHKARGIYLLLFTLVLFGFFYAIGPRDSFANEKYMTMWIHGFATLFGYYTLARSTKIDAEGFIQILLVGSISLFSFSITKYSLIPGDFFNYNWFRTQLSVVNHTEDVLIDHQQLSMIVLYGLAIFLSQTRIKSGLSLFYVLCSFQLIMMSGCRQAMLGMVLVVVLRLFFFSEKNLQGHNTIKLIIGLCFALAIAFFIITYMLSNISSTMFERTVEEGGDSERQILYLSALSLFSDNMLLGVGLGGFFNITGNLYPHNFVLELLCECGMVGTLIFLAILIAPFLGRRVKLLYVNSSGMFYFLILAVLVIRVMVSADLKESIELFSSVAAITSAVRMKAPGKLSIRTSIS